MRCKLNKNKKVSDIIQNKLTTEDVKTLGLLYKDGLKIQQRKRVYLYWFKFLQECELSNDFEVKWSEYRGWGGSNSVLGMKFDEFWKDKWKDLFGMHGGEKPKFNISSKVDLENIRLAYLVYELRDSPIDYFKKRTVRYHGRNIKNKKKQVRIPETKLNSLSIAYRLYNKENPKSRFTQVARLNPDDPSNSEGDVTSRIRTLMRKSEEVMSSVCEGKFP